MNAPLLLAALAMVVAALTTSLSASRTLPLLALGVIALVFCARRLRSQ